jgi:hypothetical protein
MYYSNQQPIITRLSPLVLTKVLPRTKTNLAHTTHQDETVAQIFTFHFHRYSKQAHLAIKKLTRESPNMPPKKQMNPVAPMAGRSSPPIGIHSNALFNCQPSSSPTPPTFLPKLSKSPKSRNGPGMREGEEATYAKATKL